MSIKRFIATSLVGLLIGGTSCSATISSSRYSGTFYGNMPKYSYSIYEHMTNGHGVRFVYLRADSKESELQTIVGFEVGNRDNYRIKWEAVIANEAFLTPQQLEKAESLLDHAVAIRE